jgi:hypothetical protein
MRDRPHRAQAVMAMRPVGDGGVDEVDEGAPGG